MSFKLTLTFDNYKESCKYINNMKKCKIKQEKKISNQILRIGKMIQSDSFDGYLPAWHHIECLFLDQTVIFASS